MVRAGLSHWSVGFYTDKFSLEMDPIDIEKQQGYSDLMALKSGMWPVGIRPDSQHMTPENNNYLVDAMDRMYTMATGEYAKDPGQLVQLLRELPDYHPMNELYEKIESFREMLNNREISGNEAIITFMAFTSELGYFGKDMKNYSFAWKGKEAQIEDKSNFDRVCLIQGIDGAVHEVDFNDAIQGHSIMSLDQLNEKIRSGEIKYEDSKYRLSMEEKQ